MPKHVKLYDDYELFDDGVIYSNKSNKFITPVLHKQSNQYYVNLYVNGKSRLELLPRLVAEYFVPKPNTSQSLIVIHKNDNNADNNSNNLKWVTRSAYLKQQNKTRNYIDSKENRKMKIKLVNRLECIDMTFNSLTEAAMYLKSSSGTTAKISSIKSALSTAAKRKGKIYNWDVIQLE